MSAETEASMIHDALDILRVDQVGSLLRPERLKAAFEQAARGELSAEQLGAAQDDAIRGVVAEQERRGLPLVTDGEFRRRHFMESFADVVGFEAWKAGWSTTLDEHGRDASDDEVHAGVNPVLVMRAPATQRLRLQANAPLKEYQFVASLSERPAKVTLIGPERIAQSYAPDDASDVYHDVDAFIADVVAIQRQMISELRAAGCPYVQIDAPGYTAYVDEPSIEEMRSRGDDPDMLLERSIAADNAVIADHPGAVFGIHLCRGNRQSMWHREGAYNAIAERVFNGLAHDRLLLEYDTERAGGFAPLRFVPKGKVVVLGLITTKTGELEDADHLVRRIEEASEYLPIEQLALSPQCGFASVLEGNLLSVDDQWRKLDLMLRTAERVWGGI